MHEQCLKARFSAHSFWHKHINPLLHLVKFRNFLIQNSSNIWFWWLLRFLGNSSILYITKTPRFLIHELLHHYSRFVFLFPFYCLPLSHSRVVICLISKWFSDWNGNVLWILLVLGCACRPSIHKVDKISSTNESIKIKEKQNYKLPYLLKHCVFGHLLCVCDTLCVFSHTCRFDCLHTHQMLFKCTQNFE